MTSVRSVELFRETAYIFSATIPATLARAEETGALTPGDLVVLVGGGTGQIYGATVLVWGT
jgi:3-oxoacyl-[acyl-carrier-protein] synthase III